HGLAAHGVKVGALELDLAAMMARKDPVVRGLSQGVASLFKKNKVARVEGAARVAGAGRVVVAGRNGEQTLEAARVLIASGSEPAPLRSLPFDGERIVSSTEALSLQQVPERMLVIGAGAVGLAAKGSTAEVEADVVLVAVGRRPYTDGLGGRELGLTFDPRGRIAVNERFETSVAGVFAIGDVITGPMLAHKASEEGVIAVECMAGQPAHVNYDAIPNIVYTWPELASVGLSEEEAAARGLAVAVGTFPFVANGRARCLNETDGGVKVLADARTDRIVGLHILGPRASDLIAE